MYSAENRSDGAYAVALKESLRSISSLIIDLHLVAVAGIGRRGRCRADVARLLRRLGLVHLALRLDDLRLIGLKIGF